MFSVNSTSSWSLYLLMTEVIRRNSNRVQTAWHRLKPFFFHNLLLSQRNVRHRNAWASADMWTWLHMSPLTYPMTSSYGVNKDSAEIACWVTSLVCVMIAKCDWVANTPTEWLALCLATAVCVRHSCWVIATAASLGRVGMLWLEMMSCVKVT